MRTARTWFYQQGCDCMAPKRKPRRRLVTVDLGADLVDQVDQLQATLRGMPFHGREGRAVTRSYVIRLAIERLYNAVVGQPGEPWTGEGAEGAASGFNRAAGGRR